MSLLSWRALGREPAYFKCWYGYFRYRPGVGASRKGYGATAHASLCYGLSTTMEIEHEQGFHRQ